MCTVTIVPFDHGVRLVCNRDERRARADALAPASRATRAGAAIYPLDPTSGGTWIGVNDSGLAAALLNRTPDAARNLPPRPTSRGLIVPALLACPTLDRAIEAAAALDCRRMEPFTALVLNRSRGLVLVSDGDNQRTASPFDVIAPLLFTSSSLGDSLVEPPRRRLFDQLILGDADWLGGQFRFHRHQWTRARHISVWMERAAAATVSRTTIDLLDGATRMIYEPLRLARSSATKAA